jgi:hypothetical protein
LTTAASVVLLFGSRRAPRPLARLAVQQVSDPTHIDAALGAHRRLVVAGTDADLAAVLTRLLRSDRLDVEVGFASRWPSAATRAYRLRSGWRGARRAGFGVPQRVPLIRDEAGVALAGAARWLAESGRIRGEAIVDDTTLFDGEATGVRIEPTLTAPGLRAGVLSGRPVWPRRPRRWVTGRAAQLGSTGARVIRDGVAAARPVRRSTFYRHTEGWLLVR